jgi:pyruvate formate lyase activating enzyme
MKKIVCGVSRTVFGQGQGRRFARALAAAARAEGLSVCLDTCGYVPYPRLQAMIPLVDVFLYDVKATSEWKHKRLTGLANRRILANLRRLGAEGARIWLRLPLIPGLTDTDENLSAIARFLIEETSLRRVELLPYNSMGESKYERLNMPVRTGHLLAQGQKEVDRLKEIFAAKGLEII